MSVVGFADMTGDGIPDLIARDTTSGALWLYKGLGNGQFGSRAKIGSGFTAAAYRSVITKGDVTGDGNVDLWALGSNGKLYLFPGDGSGGFGHRILRSNHGYWAGVTALG